jgi:thiol-disulfide isomerase/thioredoxin
LLAGAVLLSPVGARAGVDAEGWEVLRQAAREFTVKELSGRTLRSSELSGKVVVIDFWATWCAPCLKELPELAAWSGRLRERDDVAFLSFNVTEEKETVLAFVRDKQIDYPVYLGDALIGPYQVSAFPTKLIIDMRSGGKGTLRFRRDGYTGVQSIEAKVKEILGAPPEGGAIPEKGRKKK